MSKMSCIIIDDEELSRNLLEHFIERAGHLELLGKFKNPLEALNVLKEKSIDLIFLDIQMPEMTGIEFLKSIGPSSAIILTTAYEQYALEGYELSVTDYLLKPFGFNRFLSAVNKAQSLINLKQKAESTSDTSLIDNKPSEAFLLVKADHKLYRLYLKDIRYIQSMKEYVMYYTDDGRIMARGSLKKLEEELPKDQFWRIHKYYIVAQNRIKNLDGNRLNIGDMVLPIGGNYRNEVLEKFSEGLD